MEQGAAERGHADAGHHLRHARELDHRDQRAEQDLWSEATAEPDLR